MTTGTIVFYGEGNWLLVSKLFIIDAMLQGICWWVWIELKKF